MGTPAYMSPEQCYGRAVGPPSDIYGLGVVVHHALTGARLFEAPTALELMVKHATEPPGPMSAISDVPAALDASVLHMLEKEPSARPDSAGAAISELVRAWEGLGTSTPASNEGGASLSAPARDTTAIQRSAGTDRTAPTVALGAPAPPHAEEHERAPLAGASARDGGHGVAVASHGGRTHVVGLVGLVLAVLAVATFLVLRSRSEHAAAASATVQWRGVVAKPTVASGASGITLTVRATPPDATVYVGGRLLGPASLPVALPRGTADVAVTVRKAGFEAKHYTLVPDADQTLDVVLSPSAGAPAERPAGQVNPRPSGDDPRP